jgi:hypothetical protein
MARQGYPAYNLCMSGRQGAALALLRRAWLIAASCVWGCSADGAGVPAGRHAAFDVQPLPGTIAAAEPCISLVAVAQDRRINVAVHVSGDCLKALCFAVSYDQTRWHFAGISPGPAFGTDALTLTADPAPGMVHCGLVLPRFDELSGFSGNSTAAVLTFEPGPPAQQVKSFSAQHAETGVSWDAGSNSLRWGYGVQGDYDQNGEVGIADITPLGRYFGDVGPFASADVRGVIDGDGNGELNISDLTPLGINFGLHCEGYGVYFAQSEQNLPLAGVADDHNLLRATTALSQASGPAATQRLEFSSPFGAAAPNGWVWVRPLLAAGVGPPSNVLRLGSSETQNAWPAAQISANLVSGPAPLAVSFDAAASTDPDGTIVSYEWDWTGGSDGWVWQSSGADAAALHVYSVEGSYTATVRATDDEGAADGCPRGSRRSPRDAVLPLPC